jgi:hypothetical protein
MKWRRCDARLRLSSVDVYRCDIRMLSFVDGLLTVPYRCVLKQETIGPTWKQEFGCAGDFFSK